MTVHGARADGDRRDGAPTLGPWRCETILGAGSAGSVWRARHAHTGRVAAVKIVRSEREALLRAQRREIFALSRLEHPGIVGILDAGHDAGLLYCAMDLVEGPTLGQWARTLTRGRATDVRVLDVVASLAATLATLHGEGLVHRDLKPENVIITSTRAPVLVDFGLATRFPGGEGRESVGAEGGVAGTLAYLAPEVLDGELVDARSDLYALGCILYELLTGAPPFEGTPRVVARAHRERVPEPPSARTAGLDARLDALVGRLLAKRPRERVAYAADVLRALEEMGAKVAWPVTTAPRPYLYRSHLVARDGEIAQVERALERARRGAGGLISIAGPSGIGKSRLALELMRLAERSGMLVLSGSCPAMTSRAGSQPSGAPLEALRTPLEIIAWRCREWGPDEARRVLGGRARVLAPFEPTLGSIPGLSAEPEPDALMPEAARQRVLEAVADALASLGAKTPVLLVLDDLQWADDLTLGLLEFAARTRRWHASSVLVLATSRVEETGDRLGAWILGDSVERVALDRLGGEDVCAMLGEMLGGDAPPDGLLAPVLERVDGNPFFGGEYLQLLVAEGLIARDPSGAWVFSGATRAVASTLDDPTRVPRSVADLMARRTAAIGASARSVGEACAVLGREIDESVLKAVTCLPDDDFDSAVGELRRRLVLETADARLRFAHDKLREALYAGLDDTERRALHARVATVLERDLAATTLPASRALARPAIGYHHLAAGSLEAAVEHLDAAAEHSVATFANEESVRHLNALIAIGDAVGATPRRRARWLCNLGDALGALGRIDDARHASRGALDVIDRPFPKTSGSAVLGVLRELLGQLARRVLRRSRTRDVPDDEVQRLCEAVRATEQSCYLLSDAPALIYGVVRAANLAEDSGSPAQIGRCSSTLGAAFGLLSMRGLADAYLGRAMRAAVASSDGASEAWVCMIDGYYRCGIAQWDRARASAMRGEEVARKVGDPRRREECLTVACEIESLCGDVARAIDLADLGFVSARARGDRQTQLWALCDRSRMLLHLGRDGEALDALRDALPLVEQTVLADGTMAEGLLALALARTGDSAGGLEHVRRALDLARGADPTFYHGLHGCSAAVEAVACIADARTHGDDLVDLARRGAGSLAVYTRSFPVAVPKLWIARGRIERLRGDVKSAARAFERAEAMATKLAMSADRETARRERAVRR